MRFDPWREALSPAMALRGLVDFEPIIAFLVPFLAVLDLLVLPVVRDVV